MCKHLFYLFTFYFFIFIVCLPPLEVCHHEDRDVGALVYGSVPSAQDMAWHVEGVPRMLVEHISQCK